MLLPEQGGWSESDFLALHTNRMAELVMGRLEVLPMPTWLHQLIVRFLVRAIEAQIGERGAVLFAPLPVRLFPGTIREPDVLYVAPDHVPADARGYPRQVDLVMEVVSAGDEARRRDYEQKPTDYAQAGVAEYWIVDPERRMITVLGLNAPEFETLGEYREGESATGRYLPGLRVDVSAVMALEKAGPG